MYEYPHPVVFIILKVMNTPLRYYLLPQPFIQILYPDPIDEPM